MKSVVTKRDSGLHPIWNTDYEAFMKTIGFQTKLCKPVHPFTKGKVERLVQFVKNNFMAGRVFSELTDLNCEVLRWEKYPLTASSTMKEGASVFLTGIKGKSSVLAETDITCAFIRMI